MQNTILGEYFPIIIMANKSRIGLSWPLWLDWPKRKRRTIKWQRPRSGIHMTLMMVTVESAAAAAGDLEWIEAVSERDNLISRNVIKLWYSGVYFIDHLHSNCLRFHIHPLLISHWLLADRSIDATRFFIQLQFIAKYFWRLSTSSWTIKLPIIPQRSSEDLCKTDVESVTQAIAS